MEKLLLCSRVLLWVFAVFGLCRVAGAVNRDGVALIAFKTAITEDPEGVLNTWNASDQNPCSWTGISCAQIGQLQRVVAINLPKRRLVGILPSVLGSLIYLRHINLKHNRFNGTLPAQLFSVASIQSLVFYGNILTGPLPEEVARLKNLQILDLSYNSFQGTIPSSITKCSKLRRLQLNSNNFSGPIPQGIGNRLSGLQQLDLSFNKFSGSIPPDLGNLTQLEGALKLSNNILTGPVPATLGNLPEKVSLDLTYNNLSGQIPQNGALVNQGPTAFVGNPGLCGLPLRKPCPANHGSVVSNFPDMAPPRSQPSSSGSVSGKKAISRKALIAIIVGDVGGILLLSLVFLYCYWKAMSCRDRDSTKEESSNGGGDKFCRCLSSRKRDDSEVFSENMEQSDLVALDGQVSYDLDELLRASAFVLGKSGVGIVYKVVLEDGLTLAVRRLGEGGSDRYKEFQAEVESLGRLRHPNVVALRAYYWSVDEKLLIYDYVPNGSLATALHGAEAASSPLLWAARLKIAKGVARGLAHIHECCPKRHIHGDLKPSNILLGLNMEPYIADLGLGRIASVAGTLAIRPHITMLGSMYPESKVSSEPAAALPSMSSATLITQGILMSPGSAYQAPEASKNPKPTQKWDVYSYGVMLLELLSGKSAIVQVGNAELDLVRWVQLCIEEKQPLQDVLDSVLIEELYREEEILGVLKIALSCVQGSPDRRPSMKHVAEMLDKVSAAI